MRAIGNIWPANRIAIVSRSRTDVYRRGVLRYVGLGMAAVFLYC